MPYITPFFFEELGYTSFSLGFILMSFDEALKLFPVEPKFSLGAKVSFVVISLPLLSKTSFSYFLPAFSKAVVLGLLDNC